MAYSVTKEMRTETAHRLPGHPGRCRFVHGHSYRWEVTVSSEDLNLDGMVVDFSKLKALMENVIDPFDHALVLFKHDPLLPSLRIVLACSDLSDLWARVIELDDTPTAEQMVRMVHDRIKAAYTDCKVTVRVWETATSYAEFTE